MAYAPETWRAKDTSINYLVASIWHFTLIHDEDARLNNPQTVPVCVTAEDTIAVFALWAGTAQSV